MRNGQIFPYGIVDGRVGGVLNACALDCCSYIVCLSIIRPVLVDGATWVEWCVAKFLSEGGFQSHFGRLVDFVALSSSVTVIKAGDVNRAIFFDICFQRNPSR